MGGKVAQLAASRRPSGLAGLALVAPAPPRPAIDAQAAQALTRALASRATIGDTLDHMLTQRRLPDDLREQMIDDGLAGNRDAQLAWPLDGITMDITAAVGVIDVPVDEDSIVVSEPAVINEKYRELFSQLRGNF